MKPSAPDPWAVLGLAEGASREQIKRAYLALVKRWHPDQFAHDPEQQQLAGEKLRAINVAYEALVGEARVTQAFRHGSTAPAYDPGDPAKQQGRAAYAFRERPSGFAFWRGHTGWLSWIGTLALVAISAGSFWFVADSVANHYGPPFTADFIRYEAKLQSIHAKTRRAAEAGEVWAMVNLGWFHYQGRGVRGNHVEAAVWFTRAAEAGNAGAQVQLGLMLAAGDGVTSDPTHARQWWERAAAAGNEEARKLLARPAP